MPLVAHNEAQTRGSRTTQRDSDAANPPSPPEPAVPLRTHRLPPWRVSTLCYRIEIHEKAPFCDGSPTLTATFSETSFPLVSARVENDHTGRSESNRRSAGNSTSPACDSPRSHCARGSAHHAKHQGDTPDSAWSYGAAQASEQLILTLPSRRSYRRASRTAPRLTHADLSFGSLLRRAAQWSYGGRLVGLPSRSGETFNRCLSAYVPDVFLRKVGRPQHFSGLRRRRCLYHATQCYLH